MDKFKKYCTTVVMINFFINLILGLETLISFLINGGSSLAWHFPLSILLGSILSALPTLLLYNKDDEWDFSFKRIALHFILTLLIVTLLGYVLRWYTTVKGFFIVEFLFIIVYLLVWAFAFFIFKTDEKNINKALEKLRDEE